MATNWGTIDVKPAVTGYSKEDLGSTHLTTLEIGQIIPIKNIETVIGGRYPIKGTIFSRLAPLVKPTYGKLYFKTATMFIPYFQCADNIDGFVNSQKKVKGEAATSRYIKRKSILNMFLGTGLVSGGNATEVTAADVATGAYYDFTCKYGSTQKYYVFTNAGKYYIKVLNSLGYVIPQNGNSQTTNTWQTTGYGSKNLSALPLIAFAKGYNDWMSQSQRYNSSVLTKLLYGIKHDKTVTVNGTTAYNSTTHEVTDWGINVILDAIRLCYENDYFTSAWQHPNAPLEGEDYIPNGNDYEQSVDNAQLSSNTVTQNDIDNSIFRNNNDNYIKLNFDVEVEQQEVEEGEPITSWGENAALLGARAQRWLAAWDRMVNRKNYSGTKDVQQLYSFFGIKVEDYRADYAHVIGTTKAPIQIGDVTALGQDYVTDGNANNVALGDYAGKGIISTDVNFKYKASEVGLLCVYAWVTVAPMNVFGEDKKVKRVTPLDFYNPDFDGVGPEPISVDEVYVNPRLWSATAPDAVYGFTEKYNSFRYANDQITGDFRKFPLYNSQYENVGCEMNVWHLGRYLNTQLMQQSLVAQNPAVNQVKQLNSEYNRIFSVTSGNQDHFYITAQFECNALLPVKSLSEATRLGEGNLTVTRNGNEIN